MCRDRMWSFRAACKHLGVSFISMLTLCSALCWCCFSSVYHECSRYLDFTNICAEVTSNFYASLLHLIVLCFASIKIRTDT